ncbi:MAG TPA: cytochrome c oxidase assembly protein [Rhizomicrobium sp.]|nr:cytochrome c oxidase assembly protein [Rhizomicrobium sp.]
MRAMIGFADIAVGAALLGFAAIYGAGLARLPRRSGASRAPLLFACGFAVAAADLFSPLGALAHDLFAAHMIQHLILVLAVAPLLALGRIGAVVAWSIGAQARRLSRAFGGARAARWARRPLNAFLAFNAVFLFWHLPAAYRLSQRVQIAHAGEIASLLICGTLFWSAAIGRRRALGDGGAVLYLTATAFITDIPGVLMLFSARALYAAGGAAAQFGLSPLQDQQLAGVIMWVPASLVFFGAAIWRFARWLEPSRAAAYAGAARVLPLVLVLFAAPLSGCREHRLPAAAKPAVVGDAARGAGLIGYYGCGACHSIPGIAGADAMVGPPLDHFARRVYIAGVLRNTPDNLALWIHDPQAVIPGNVMPIMGVDKRDARDIAAYLYTLR